MWFCQDRWKKKMLKKIFRGRIREKTNFFGYKLIGLSARWGNSNEIKILSKMFFSQCLKWKLLSFGLEAKLFFSLNTRKCEVTYLHWMMYLMLLKYLTIQHTVYILSLPTYTYPCTIRRYMSKSQGRRANGIDRVESEGFTEMVPAEFWFLHQFVTNKEFFFFDSIIELLQYDAMGLPLVYV